MLAKTALVIGAVFVAGGVIMWKHSARESVLLAGSFHSVAHKGTGWAQIVQRADGSRTLRLIQAKTYPSNDLAVCLIAAPDAEDNDTVRQSGFVCLGSFGDSRTYPVPASMDLNRYHAVTIWNRPYQVNFTTAPLRK